MSMEFISFKISDKDDIFNIKLQVYRFILEMYLENVSCFGAYATTNPALKHKAHCTIH